MTKVGPSIFDIICRHWPGANICCYQYSCAYGVHVGNEHSKLRFLSLTEVQTAWRTLSSAEFCDISIWYQNTQRHRVCSWPVGAPWRMSSIAIWPALSASWPSCLISAVMSYMSCVVAQNAPAAALESAHPIVLVYML